MALAPSDALALTVGDVTVREIDGLYSLNDLHRASGGEKRHQPGYFLANDQTKALVAEIETTGIPAVSTKEGRNGGTYACREIVVAFAAWISAAFHLKVIRVFLGASSPANAERAELARALASKATTEIYRTVFDAVMQGDSEWWRHGRYLLNLNYGPDGQPSVPWAKVLPTETMTVSMDELPARLLGADALDASDAQLARLAGACADRIARRAVRREQMQRVREAENAPQPTFARVLSAPRGWKDEAKARALMESVRLREDERMACDTAPPERIEELHRQGRIGPRQFAKFKELMS
ncbi:KilA-N domain-containing protein [Paracidovorax avenae]|uniref:KilA-N domain-containing protein n=1 Tax=Paracidovorax avenae TaxID=80867 RepID=UPI0006B3C08E|nr:KilA-N domain-containing protein [Paracidovorax avenae]